jgi:serine/threonine-protein kinase RsbW
MSLRVPGEMAYRHLAIRFVSLACKIACKYTRDTAPAGEAPSAPSAFEARVISAFGEAFNNVAVHGYRGLPTGPVDVEVAWDAEKLVVTMIDSGHTFDPSSVGPPNLDDLPEEGMGLFIMRSYMDEVDYRPGPPNILRLVKRRGGSDG